MHGEEGVVAAVFDGAFAVAVDEDGALLSLGIGDTTDVDEGFDDVVESVDVVVVEDEAASRIFKDVGLILWEGRCEWVFHMEGG